jgi:hypothetical protein
MTRTFSRLAQIGGLVAATVGMAGAGASAQDQMAMVDKSGTTYVTYRNAKHGFSLAYPAIEFQGLPSATPDGFQAVSKDGKARLLVGTIANFDGKTLAEYRKFILDASYPGAKLDYAPVRDTWFVLSGVKADGTTAFYQRVNFVCGGGNVNSWAVIFPYEEESVYSTIIEWVHKNYRLGDGNCSTSTMRQQPRQTGTTAPATQPKQMAAMAPTVPPKQVAAMEPATPPKQMAAMAPAMRPQRMASMGTAEVLAAYNNDKNGFSLNYPTSRFLALPAATPDWFQAVSRDGKARLLAGTIANFDAKSLGAYRNFLLAEAYPGAKLDDTPSLGNGFVLSGVKSDGTTAFYQRVSFVCGGRNINSWTVTFPDAERPVYAPIIEQVGKDFRLGDGNCSAMPPMQPKDGAMAMK